MIEAPGRLDRLSPEQKRALLAQMIAEKQKASQQPSAQPIPVLPRNAATNRFPLSFAQQRLWFLDQLEPGNPVYNEFGALRLTGNLDIAALAQTINQIAARHEVLRTTIAVVNEKPVQVVSPPRVIPMPVTDISDLSKTEREAEVLAYATAQAQEPFDLAKGSLIRPMLLRLGELEHVLCITVHHIVWDAWSIGVFMHEFAALYKANQAMEAASLPELSIQYADYAAWQRDRLQGALYEAQLDYWKQQLGNHPPILELPTDYPRPAVQTYNGATISFDLPQALSSAVKMLSRQHGTTLFMTLLAAFKTLLYRYTGQTDILVGSPIAGRSRLETEGLIGFFVNTLALRTELDGDIRFTELLQNVRETCLAAYRHEDIPFEKLVEVLQPERDRSRLPLVQVNFMLHNAPVEKMTMADDLTLSPLDIDRGTAKYDLTLYIWDSTTGLSGSIEYNTDLFKLDTIKGVQDHFQTLLHGIVTDPEQPISQLPLLTEAVRQRMLVEPNTVVYSQSMPDYANEVCFQTLFEMQVTQTPNNVAVTCSDKQLTYQDLNGKANQLARHLRDLNVGPEVKVAICMDRSLEMMVGLLAVLKAGGAYIPLDPSYPTQRLAYMIEDSQPHVLLTQKHIAKLMPLHNAQIVCLDQAWDDIDVYSSSNLEVVVDATNLAYMIYTSGSTGHPKGTMINHRGLSNYLHWCLDAYPVAEGRGALVHSTIAFDATITGLFSPLLAGKTVFMVPENDDLEALSVILQKEQDLSLIKITPAHLTMLGHQLSPQDMAKATRSLVVGGENLTADQISAWQKYAPQTRIFNEYGPTENVVGCVVYEVPIGWEDVGSVPIGRTIPNSQVYVLDQHMEPRPVGVPGELYLGGIAVARGYANRPDLTAEKFIPDPFSNNPGRRLYRTGDLVRYLSHENGESTIEFLGRIDDQVKIRGHRIELGEIEAALGQHEAIQQATVTVFEDASGDNRLAAYCVPAIPDTAVPVSVLRTFLKTQFPDAMIPAAFIFLEALPLTTNGKVNRKLLPVPDMSRSALVEAYVPPRNQTEALLTEIWADVLGANQVGIHDNFFDLGGHSLLATQLVSRIRDVFQIALPLGTLFEATTVADLATQVDILAGRSEIIETPRIKTAVRKAPIPVSYSQQRLWLLEQLDPGNPAYNVPAAIQLAGPLNVQALEQSFNEIICRHEALRTTFKEVNGEPSQIISEPYRIQIPVIDLQHLPELARETEARRLAVEDAHRAFDLTTGPLLRLQLLKLADQDHVALFSMHHIVSDGWSVEVLLREFTVLYSAYDRGLDSPLSDLPIQYADFAVWQSTWLQEDTLATQLDFWQKQLQGRPTSLALPTDRPRQHVQTYSGATETFIFSPELSNEIKALGRQENTTLFMTLLAAFQALLHRYTGQPDINVGVPIANRNRTEIEGLIGFFVNTLVLSSHINHQQTFRALLHEVRKVTLDAYAHQDLPFEKLVEALQPDRNMSHSPLFQVMFVFDDGFTPNTQVGDLAMDVLDVDRGIAKFDLTLFMSDHGDQLTATFEYNTDLFDATTIARMAEHFQILATQIIAMPDQPLATLSILPDAEKQQLLTKWNNTQTDALLTTALHQMFEAQVLQTPDKAALIFDGVSLTYQEFNERANQLAHHLRALGVGSDVLVGVFVERSFEMMIGLMAVLKAGGAYVPLDPNYPQDRLAFMLADTRTSVVLTQQSLVKQLPVRDILTICLDSDQHLQQYDITNPEIKISPDQLAYVIYTSGSTGQPKGAMITHQGLTNYMHWCLEAYPLAVGSGSLVHSTIAFDATVTALFSPLMIGGSVSLMPDTDDLEALKGALQSSGGYSLVKITPAHLDLLSQQITPDEARTLTKSFVIGGENLTAEQIAFWQAHAGDTLLFNEYGPTETVVGCVVYEAANWQGTGSVPIGRAISNTQVYVLDQNLEISPIGVPGELYIGGVGVARGYLNRPDITAEKFIPNPFSDVPGARIYRSGDLVRYVHNSDDEPLMEFLGRLDDQVKIRGFRIEMGEVEAALNQHPAIQQATVIVQDDQASSRGIMSVGKHLVGYIVTGKEPAPSLTELRNFLLETLPDYMVPSVFVTLEALPLTNNGKVDRKALLALEGSRLKSDKAGVVPRSETEHQLAAIWQDVLNVEDAGVHDNFFELGGHSLLGAKMIAHLREQFQVDLPLRRIFEEPTIAGIAHIIDATRQEDQRTGEDLAAMLQQLDSLSDEEAKALLAGMTGD